MKKKKANIVETFAADLLRRRRGRGLSLRQMAKHVNIPTSNLFRLEAGQDPRLSELAQLAKAFGEGVGEFVGALE